MNCNILQVQNLVSKVCMGRGQDPSRDTANALQSSRMLLALFPPPRLIDHWIWKSQIRSLLGAGFRFAPSGYHARRCLLNSLCLCKRAGLLSLFESLAMSRAASSIVDHAVNVTSLGRLEPAFSMSGHPLDPEPRPSIDIVSARAISCSMRLVGYVFLLLVLSWFRTFDPGPLHRN